MAGERTVSGHITWKQQAGSVLQQRKIFRSSLTTRRSHFIWPEGCGQWKDTLTRCKVGCAVMHLSLASHHTFPPFLWEIQHFSTFFSVRSFLTSSWLCPLIPPSPRSFLPHPSNFLNVPSLTLSLPLCLWSVTVNLAPSICFSSLV